MAMHFRNGYMHTKLFHLLETFSAVSKCITDYLLFPIKLHHFKLCKSLWATKRGNRENVLTLHVTFAVI